MKKLEEILMKIDVAQMIYISQRNLAVENVEIIRTDYKSDSYQLMSLSVCAGVAAKFGRDLRSKIMDALRLYNNISFFSLSKYQYWGFDERMKFVIKLLDHEISNMELIKRAADERCKKVISSRINSHLDNLF
jgi:hypothetical protein